MHSASFLAANIWASGRRSPFLPGRRISNTTLLVVSARNAAEMRKSPQSKKPLHFLFSAPSVCLAGMSRAEGVEAKLTVLRVVHRVPSAEAGHAR